jgi:outer membrane receptor protein involved in Fe transport
MLAGPASPRHNSGRSRSRRSRRISPEAQRSLQDVPLSIQAIGQEQLSELKVDDFSDYVKFLPNVSYQSFGPGFSRPYMRGVASGENANHSGPLPSVGVYLDEQPITTIQGPLDVQIYDVARVEVLAGPQGTLYGASSQAGTIRIITNKPRSGVRRGLRAHGQHARRRHGLCGQGFVNVPIGDKAAIRMVGWTSTSRVHRQRAFDTRLPGVGHRARQQFARRGQLQRLDQDRRAYRARDQSQ